MEISNFYLDWFNNSKFICTGCPIKNVHLQEGNSAYKFTFFCGTPGIRFCLFLVYKSKFSGGSAAQAMIQS